MSQSGWYHDKASECDRMALASRSVAARDRHIKDRDNWHEIAARIDAAEEAIKQRKKRISEAVSGRCSLMTQSRRQRYFLIRFQD